MLAKPHVECNFEFLSHLQLSSHAHTTHAGISLNVLWSVWFRVGGPVVCCGQRALTRAYVAVDVGLVSGTGAQFVIHVS